MHGSGSPGDNLEGRAASPAEMFELFLLRSRRSAVRQWLLEGILRAVVWNALLFIVLISLRHVGGLKLENLLGAFAAFSLVTCLLLWWYRRDVLLNFAEHLDDSCQAGGRISSAAEFIRQGSCDAYKQIAIGEAGQWLASRPQTVLDKRRAWETYAVIPAGTLLYLVCRYL